MKKIYIIIEKHSEKHIISILLCNEFKKIIINYISIRIRVTTSKITAIIAAINAVILIEVSLLFQKWYQVFNNPNSRNPVPFPFPLPHP